MRNQKIIISCDTTIALSKEEIAKEGLYVIPLNAIADGVEYHDTVDIDAEKLCELMRNGAKISTSTPTIIEIENYFDDLFAKTNADVVIHFTISSKLSSMFSLFTTVCKEKYGDKVIVVDSLSICCWIKRQVFYARDLVNRGLEPAQIVQKVKEDLCCSEDCVFVPESIEYLKRGGRISAATATFANLVKVVPILTFNNGEVGKKGVTRTMQKAIINAIQEWNEKIEYFNDKYEYVVLSSDSLCQERVDKIVSLIKELDPHATYSVNRLSLNVTAHTGPGTSGLGIIKKMPE